MSQHVVRYAHQKLYDLKSHECVPEAEEPTIVTGRPVVRYGNRKLYDLKTRKYVSYSQIKALLLSGECVKVIDYVTGEDRTTIVMADILAENLKSRPQSVTVRALLDLIRQSEPVV